MSDPVALTVDTAGIRQQQAADDLRVAREVLGTEAAGLQALAASLSDGFGAAIEHAILFPLAGLDNPQLGLRAQPAQLIRLRLTYSF